MTFNQIVQKVMTQLNLTSDDARTRAGESVNDRYKRVTSSIGLQTSRRETMELDIDPDDADSTLPDYEIEGLEKVLRVWRRIGATGIKDLDEYTYTELSMVPTKTAQPTAWAVKRMGAGTVTITIDAFPEEEFELMVEGYDLADTLENDQEPYLPTDFHDILVAGAMSDELLKMEKPQLAEIQENKYENRLSDLRMFIAKSSYLDILQGKQKVGNLWYRKWFSRIIS